jgi:dethiobiotin synthetase
VKKYFITATGTGIGKTAITCALVHQLIKNGKKVAALKPVISGWEDVDTDTHKILAALNLPATQENIEKISPWRFTAPLSPDVAAKMEGRVVDFAELVTFCEDVSKSDYLLIEGAGGVMTPITNNKTMADLIAALQIPAILIAGTYLGTISHTLAALKALESYNIEVSHIVLNQSKDCAGADYTINCLKNFTDIPIVFVARVEGEVWKTISEKIDFNF